jgi:hypothetical protein
MTNTAASGSRNSAIADGQWHSFGHSGSSFAANGRGSSAISSSRGTSGLSGSRLGTSTFANPGLGRGFGDRGFGGFGGYGRGWRGGGWGGWGWGGWGWGFGWGWGWPYLGFGWGYPGWYYPWAWGGYGGPYPYPYYAPWGYDDFSYYTDNSTDDSDNSTYAGPPYAPNDYGYDAAPGDSGPSSQGSLDTNPNPITDNVGESTPTVLVYLKDGTMFTATDYWLSGSEFHYVVSYGREGAIDIGQLDWQRTANENAKRGIHFSMKSKPGAAGSSPTASAPSPALRPAPQIQAAAQLQKGV